MKFSSAVVRCLLAPVVVKGFTTTTRLYGTKILSPPFGVVTTTTARGFGTLPTTPSSGTTLSAGSEGGTDDYDEWYADFDPSQFDEPDPAPKQQFRGSGGGHDYTRDVAADNSNVDLNAVDELISNRLQARKTGQFEVADAIRDELLDDHGVTIWDRDRQWRSGCSRSGSGSKWGGNNQRGGGQRGGNQRGGQRGGGRPPRDFGPTGHDYSLSQDAGPNTTGREESEIHEMIAERLQCKMSRNFQEADAIQLDLEAQGIYVHDGNKEWRADGERFGSYQNGGQRGPGRTQGSRQDRFRPYVKSQYSASSPDEDTISNLIEDRVEAKKARDFHIADEIQQELRSDFNVEINDKTREWSVGGDFGMGFRKDLAPYGMSSLSQEPEDAQVIQDMVEDREKARKRRDYQTADDIRDELRAVYDVEVQDKLRQWSVGGEFERSNNRNDNDNRNGDRGPAPDFVRRGGGSLTDEEATLIAEMVAERNEAKKNKHFGKADRIRDSLRDDYKVRVDDRSREWMVVSDEYVMAPVTPLDDGTKKYIEDRVAERAVAKLNKEYDTADAIRDELLDEYQVYLDDRVREWRIEGAEAVVADTVVEDDDTDDADDDDEADDEMFADLDAALEDVFDDDEDDVEEEAEVVAETSGEDLTSLKVDELKEKLREAGLPVSGKKAELIERLMEKA